MESFLFWILNSVETGLIFGMLLHIRKSEATIRNLQKQIEDNMELQMHDLAEQIPNCFILNGETIRLRRKE